MEYRQKVNRCGLHTDRNGMKSPAAKYLVGADEGICQDLWWWSIQYTFIKDKHVFLHFLLSLSLVSSEIKMTQCICRGQKCILSAWDCTILGFAVSAGMPAIALQPSNSDLSVLHSPLLIFPHCGGIESFFYHVSEITAHAIIRFHTLRRLGTRTRGLPHTYVHAHSRSSIFMDHSHCHTLSQRSTS